MSLKTSYSKLEMYMYIPGANELMMKITYWINARWMPTDLIDDKSTLVKVMARYSLAPSH